MKINGIIFITSFLLVFAGGYFFFTQDDKSVGETITVKSETTNKVEKEEEGASVSADTEAFNNNSCITCHAVSVIGIEGGVTGPDLSTAYEGIEGKHGMDIDSFLQKPSSAVMSGVMEGSPLSDTDRAEIIEMLKKASEK